ncbi:MAG TPA: tRNA 2-thiouridine(34) synthase MnmA [Solirubrobacteraceae bacterium]|nr:tRNA 2-thiouridine(34) synthase MnmA [Solirubrobacteraceae bacterium]
MDAEAFADHLEYPRGRAHVPPASFSGSAGGAPCGDLVRIDLAIDGDRVVDAGFEASGCGAAVASGSAAVDLLRGARVLDAARIGAGEVAAELGGLSPGKLHAAELAADALHVALGAALAAGAGLGAAENGRDNRSSPATATLDPSRTLVAMSGGVDSAVAALLVQRSGREAVAVTLELWRDPANDAEASCCSAHAVRLARSVAHRMGMPHFTLDLRAAFAAGVVAPFLADHAAGLTPNPCVRCNGDVRLDAMLAFADRLGAADLATGHYARVTPDGLLRAAADPAKDQSYMLAALAPSSLARLRFPLGALRKPQVRELAREAGLPVADKRESQDLCFLAGTGKSAFLARHGGMRERPGAILDRAGRTLGRHRGQHLFTIGQRKGLGVAGEEPLYVLAKDRDANTVTVGTRAELATTEVAVRDAVLHRPSADVDRVKLRYRTVPLPCRVAIGEDGGLALHLAEPVDGAAPGQVACLMRGDVIVGHGVIAG